MMNIISFIFFNIIFIGKYLINESLGNFFLGEQIFYYHILGSILIVGGVLGANFLDKDPVKT